MPISLYDAFVPSCLQVIGSVRGLVDKAEAHCSSTGCAPEEIIEARLYRDMLPFSYQVKSVAVHGFGAIKGVRRGLFARDSTPPPPRWPQRRGALPPPTAGLGTVTAEELEDLIGRETIFSIPAINLELTFTAENFLLSFSQPNFYFHATTAYGILRHNGLDIGKKNFLGAMRFNHPA